MSSLAFLVATYNEEAEILDLLSSVRPYVDTIVVSDDGSTDSTLDLVIGSRLADIVVMGPHVASCEETSLSGLQRVTEDWTLILDADERIDAEGLARIRDWVDLDTHIITASGVMEPSAFSTEYTHLYFSQDEYIDGNLTRSFAKIKLVRTKMLHLPVTIHGDIACDGEPINLGIKVNHRKTSQKQIMREMEYLEAYEQKIKEGKMTRDHADWATGFHYYVRNTR